MAGLRHTLGTAAAAFAATTLLAGAALAGGNPTAPGTAKAPAKGGTPPGQAKKGTTGSGSVSTHAKAKAHARVTVRTHPSHPAHPSHPLTPSSQATVQTQLQATVHGPALHQPAFAATKGQGHASTAQQKVILCHRTGSATNPFVTINVSINGSLNGHSKHPSAEGRSDIMLSASATPGQKPSTALVPQLCGAAAPQQQPGAAAAGHASAQQKVIICHRTGSTTNPFVAINVSMNGWMHGHSKEHVTAGARSDVMLSAATPGQKPSTALVAQLCAAAAPQQQSGVQAAGVLGVQQSVSVAQRIAARQAARLAAAGVKGVTSKVTPRHRASGVLGAFASRVTRRQLPITGLPLWPALLLGAALLAGGLLLRRRAAHTS